MNAILIRITAPLALAIGSMTPATARPADGLGPLLGSWRVTGVTVAASPVQAVTPDDPSLMGAILDVARERLSWRAPYRSTSLDASCDMPRLVRGTILCRSGSFGPPGSRATWRGDTLTLAWYDGASLRLTRLPARRNAASTMPRMTVSVPPALRGKWAANFPPIVERCNPRYPDGSKWSITADASRFYYWEARGTPIAIRQPSSNRFVIDLAFEGEGKRWTDTRTFILADGGRTLLTDEALPELKLRLRRFRRCPSSAR